MEGYKNTGLDKIAKSYDRAIDLGRQGIDPYENLPDYIKNNPNYFYVCLFFCILVIQRKRFLPVHKNMFYISRVKYFHQIIYYYIFNAAV